MSEDTKKDEVVNDPKKSDNGEKKIIPTDVAKEEMVLIYTMMLYNPDQTRGITERQYPLNEQSIANAIWTKINVWVDKENIDERFVRFIDATIEFTTQEKALLLRLLDEPKTISQIEFKDSLKKKLS